MCVWDRLFLCCSGCNNGSIPHIWLLIWKMTELACMWTLYGLSCILTLYKKKIKLKTMWGRGCHFFFNSPLALNVMEWLSQLYFCMWRWKSPKNEYVQMEKVTISNVKIFNFIWWSTLSSLFFLHIHEVCFHVKCIIIWVCASQERVVFLLRNYTLNAKERQKLLFCLHYVSVLVQVCTFCI